MPGQPKVGRINNSQMPEMLKAATLPPDAKRVAVDDAAQLLGSGSSPAGRVLGAFGIKLDKQLTQAEVRVWCLLLPLCRCRCAADVYAGLGWECMTSGALE